MSQHDMVIANQGFAAFRADMNNAVQALASTSIGSAAPSTIYSGQKWIDNSGSPWVEKVYDGADSIETMRIDTANNRVEFRNLGLGSAAAPALAPGADTDTGIYFEVGKLHAAVAGVNRLTIDTAGVVWNEGGGNYDFRVEGDTNANLIHVDAGFDAVAIGTAYDNAHGGRLQIESGTADDATTVDVTFPSGSAGSGQTRFQSHTASISTSAENCGTADQGGLLMVFGDDGGGNRFCDLVMMSQTASPTVVQSYAAQGSPAARTYARSAANVTLQMGSGTYSVRSFGIGLRRS